MGHRQDVEGGVELLAGELAGLDETALEHDRLDRLALLERLLGDRGRLLVADVLVQRGDDRRRGLGVARGSARRRRRCRRCSGRRAAG